MAEDTAPLVTSNDGLGSIRVADEVVSVIAGLAAMDVDGVAGMSGGLIGGIAEMLGAGISRRALRLKSASRKPPSIFPSS